MMDVPVPASLSWLAPIEVEGLDPRRRAERRRVSPPRGAAPRGRCADLDGTRAQLAIRERCPRAQSRDARARLRPHRIRKASFNREYVAEVAALLTGKVGPANVGRRRRRVRDYRAWFGKEATHFRERIHDRQDSQSVDIATVFARAGEGRVFVKMDIEGTEYRVLEDVVSHADRILGMAIEFHDTGPLRPVFERTMEVVRRRFEIVHVHANNFTPLYRDGFPEALEITVVTQGPGAGHAAPDRNSPSRNWIGPTIPVVRIIGSRLRDDLLRCL